VLVGGWALWLGCDLKETGLTGFSQTVCEGPVPGIGLSLVLLAPLGTAAAGLVSREYDKTPWPFYIAWAAGIALGIACSALASIV
jgi:hypothetical protein